MAKRSNDPHSSPTAGSSFSFPSGDIEQQFSHHIQDTQHQLEGTALRANQSRRVSTNPFEAATRSSRHIPGAFNLFPGVSGQVTADESYHGSLAAVASKSSVAPSSTAPATTFQPDTIASLAPAHSLSSARNRTPSRNASRRGNRKRTGPLSQEQRKKAAIIRKMGACLDCRNRRVACNPAHHNMTWEDAAARAGISLTGLIADDNHRSEDMDVDLPQSQCDTPQTTGSIGGNTRTPLPSGPGTRRDSAMANLQELATRISQSPFRNKYTAATVLLLCWDDDDTDCVYESLTELYEVFCTVYGYKGTIKKIPAMYDLLNRGRWMRETVDTFMGADNRCDVLKVIVYSGDVYLDGHREMVLASPSDRNRTMAIRWHGIRQAIEEACSDTLVLMDSAYHPSLRPVRRQGVLEFVAAVSSESHLHKLGRTSFTKSIARLLRTRAEQAHKAPFTAAELHTELHSEYPTVIGNLDPAKAILTSYPSPVYMRVSENPRLPSIRLVPQHQPPAYPKSAVNEQFLVLRLNLADNGLDPNSWAEWLSTMPPEIIDVKVERLSRASRAP